MYTRTHRTKPQKQGCHGTMESCLEPPPPTTPAKPPRRGPYEKYNDRNSRWMVKRLRNVSQSTIYGCYIFKKMAIWFLLRAAQLIRNKGPLRQTRRKKGKKNTIKTKTPGNEMKINPNFVNH